MELKSIKKGEKTDKEEKYDELSNLLTLYFIYGKMDLYKSYENYFNNNFEFHAEDVKIQKEITNIAEKNNYTSIVSVLNHIFKENRSDFEREQRTMKNYLKKITKLKCT